MQHAAQRHARDAEPRGGLADAQADLGEHVLAQDLARVDGVVLPGLTEVIRQLLFTQAAAYV
ncbi:hypothetical protein N802_05510 [Knoellia sinensis KCTC 19936]|uniref:Uncharacterized protein n=1 Tax=Knoellia sinensis KCTC 19936 TaxID=1385520 RepID=A0A0A0J3Z7_9MICO|nr:hypothetical protein N802_05510 [Knoellia sinensis KCTC 19936]